MNREILERPFPEALIRTRKGALGQTFSYVEGRRVSSGGSTRHSTAEWSFEIVEHHIRDTEVVVLGKLTAGSITKMAFGGSSITVTREGEVISIADDLKSAATDALKKAASLLGVGLHLYSEPAARPRPRARPPRPRATATGQRQRYRGTVPAAMDTVPARDNSATGRLATA